MGAVNFSLDKNLVKTIQNFSPVDTLVETGTFEGDTIRNLLNDFKTIYSTEISIEYFDRAISDFKNHKHVKLYQLSSPEFIKKIQPDIKNNSSIYWLDAHWMVADFAAGEKSQCPLLEELDAIGELNNDSYIFIDDARLFLTTPPYPHEKSHWPSFDSIVNKLQSLSKKHKIMVLNDTILFYPNKSEEIINEYAYKHSIDWLAILHKSRDYDNLRVQFDGLMPQMEKLEAEILQSKQKDVLIKSLHRFANELQQELKRKQIPFETQFAMLPGNLLSIIIPTYNQGQYIEDCLKSILNQTYQDIEIIIQDSNSTDQTESICKKYATIDPRIQYYREKDEGQSDAINRGLAKAKGDYWTWICSDDRYHANPDALKNLIQHFFEKHSESSKVVGVYGNAFFMNETGEILHEYGNFKKDLTVEHFIHNWPLSQPSSILLTKAVRQVNGVDKNLFLGMDLDLFIKILKNGNQFVFVDTPVVDIRLQDNSKSVKYRKDTALNALNLILSHFNTIGNYQESAYFKELFLTAETTEIRKFLSKLNWKFKWKYRVMNLLEKTSITQKLLHLLRKLRG